MSWGINIDGLYLSKVAESDLEDYIEKQKSYLQSIQNELIALASYTDSVYFDGAENWGLVEWAVRRVPELVEEISDVSCNLMLAQQALENRDSPDKTET